MDTIENKDDQYDSAASSDDDEAGESQYDQHEDEGDRPTSFAGYKKAIEFEQDDTSAVCQTTRTLLAAMFLIK